jgi:hypothetical protein
LSSILTKTIAKYLRVYAEPECAALEDFPAISPQHYLVIPCYSETPDFARRLAASALGFCSALIIVVINQPPGVHEPLNSQLRNYFQQYSLLWQKHHLSLFSANNEKLHWLVVDRFSPGLEIDPKQGVGLARKLGCDLAAFLMAKNPTWQRWICTTDADAILPGDYFAALDSVPIDSSAAVFSVEHITNESNAIFNATKIYECALRYYVDGLAWAGSPYAFPTIGSALAVSLQAYCECRGFPRRAGGEDFYLLNKLAKLGAVSWLKKPTIQLMSRISNRAPFGTGPAVKKILELDRPDDFTYYAPEAFSDLRAWLRHIPAIWLQLQAGRDPLKNLPTHLQAILTDAGIENLFVHLRRQIDNPQQCTRAVHHWFDAFQTLKFIRRLQDLYYPAQPLAACLRNAPFYPDEPPCWKS